MLSRRAQAGDPGALRELRALLVNETRLLDLMGDTGRLARIGWAGVVSGDDPGVREAIMLRSEQIIEMFAGSRATSIELILAEQIATAWLRLTALSVNETVEAKQWDRPAGGFLLNRHDEAMRQFYESIRQLEEYRRLVSRTAKIGKH